MGTIRNSILLLLIAIATPALTQTLHASLLQRIPNMELGSWEAWIEGTISGTDKPRPDGEAKMAKLPVWVDCHLSWRLDQPADPTKKNQFPSEIILRANPKICDGQLEQWVR